MGKVYHAPQEKPVPLLRWLIRAYSNPGMVVFDGSMGSNSCGEAALLEGRGYIGIEREPEHYATAVARVAPYLDKTTAA